MLFIDYNSALNTIVSSTLITKLRALGRNPSLCNWIFDFLMGRPQVEKVGNTTSTMLILNTVAPVPGRELVPSHRQRGEEGATAPLQPQEAWPLRPSQNSTHSPKLEHPVGLFTVWYDNYTVRNHRALQRVVQSPQRISQGRLPALQDIYSSRCHRKAK
jgi:hypothetical protein